MGKDDKKVASKQLQIEKASSTVFIAVAAASVVVSISLVLLNILWGTARYNSQVHGAQELARDTLQNNLTAVDDLEVSFNELESSQSIVPNQSPDKTNSEVVLDALPSKFDYPALVSSIDNLASRSAVVVQQIDGTDEGSDAQQSSNRPAPLEIPISISVEGPYISVAKFLDNLEKSVRPMEAETVSLSGTTSNLRADITLVTYYQPAFDLTITKQEVR